MKITEIEKLNQLVSRTDMTGNEKVDWLTDFIDKREEQLRIAVVVGSLPTEEQIDDKVSRVAASTWGDYGAGYIDGTRNGASWVIDVVNGEDK